MFDPIHVARSALKHGVSSADITHAVRRQVVLVRQAPDRLFVIGPAANGELLEIVVLEATDEDALLAIHAMKLRSKFYRLL